MMLKLSRIVPLMALLLSSTGAAQQPAGAGQQAKEEYTAIATNISGVGGTGIAPFEISIDGWTSLAEEERLMAILDEKGQQGLVSALQDLPEVARLRTPGSLSYPFHYARQTKLPDGRRRVMLVTDRPIGFAEAVNRPVSLEYPFTLVDLRIDASGHGEGQMFYATKFIRSGDLLVLENYATTPIRITELRPKK